MQNLKEILADIARAIVDHPDDVVVTEQEKGDDITLVLNVHADDMGMVIGRHGESADQRQRYGRKRNGSCRCG